MLRLFKKVKKQKRFGFAAISVFLVLILILSLFTPNLSFADSWPSCLENIEAEGAVLLDANSGTVLYAKNEHNKYFPASIT